MFHNTDVEVIGVMQGLIMIMIVHIGLLPPMTERKWTLDFKGLEFGLKVCRGDI